MRRTVTAIALVIAVAMLAACAERLPDRPVPAGSGVEGFVLDSGGRPIANAPIEIRTLAGGQAMPEEVAWHSDSLGRYAIPVSPGDRVVRVTAPGYAPITVAIVVRDRFFTRQDFAMRSPSR
jgi:hypothetical protein